MAGFAGVKDLVHMEGVRSDGEMPGGGEGTYFDDRDDSVVTFDEGGHSETRTDARSLLAWICWNRPELLPHAKKADFDPVTGCFSNVRSVLSMKPANPDLQAVIILERPYTRGY